jgi:hypothetical protein
MCEDEDEDKDNDNDNDEEVGVGDDIEEKDVVEASARV